VSFIAMMRRFERIYGTLDGEMMSHFQSLIYLPRRKGMFKNLRRNFIYFGVNLQNPTNNLFVALHTDSSFEYLPPVNVQ